MLTALADVLRDDGRLDQALEIHRRSAELAAGMPGSDVGERCAIGLARTHLAMGEPNKALGELEPLLDHPRSTIRERAADVMGLVFNDLGSEQVEGVAEFQPALMALARRDPTVEVRIAATRALGAVRGTRTTAMLEEIAADDPEQVVRYHAQRLLLEHRLAEAAKARASGDGGIRPDWSQAERITARRAARAPRMPVSGSR